MSAYTDTTRIDGQLFARMVKGGAVNLKTNKSVVNDLNVFPIPDGDTGDNMYMTIDSGVRMTSDSSENGLSDISSALAKGMLLGARGNSGVILSKIFAGIAHGLEEQNDVSVFEFGQALSKGVDEAYKAVSVPVEGTILTVYKDAVNFANEEAAKNDEETTVGMYFENFLAELKNSLDRTPELLAVLKEAGVVDSGGAGLVFIAEGMQDVIKGNAPSEESSASSDDAGKKGPDLSKFNENSELVYGYCTEFLLQLLNSKTDAANFDITPLSDYLNSVGESVVCFKDGTIVKVHVHTMNPGEILNHCQQYGEFLTLKIENMTLQHNETTIQNRFIVEKKKPRKEYGVVTVATGSGVIESFKEMGVDAVIEGGQSMNPSVEDFIKAFEEINAATILVFPNNGNIIMTANEAAAMYENAEVRVVPSKSIGDGYASISMLDTSSGDTDAIVAEAEDIMSSVVTGMVSRASRDTEKDGIQITKDHFIGFTDKTIYFDSTDKNEAALALAEKNEAGSHDIILLIYGNEATPEEANNLATELSARYRRTETIPLFGGQNVYDYILIFE